MNSFLLTYEQDGVFLEIPEERSIEIDRDELMLHLSRKRIINLSVPTVQTLLEEGNGRARIAITQSEHIYGEDLTVEALEGDLVAEARLIEPEPGGPLLELEAAKEIINKAGVVHGIDDEALQKLLDKKNYGEPYPVARSTPPEDGEDGKLIFHFSTDERTGRPVEVGGGRVDYRILDLFIPVTEGQLLVTKTDATPGMPGTSVKGFAIKQRPGKEIALPRGKNIVYNNERTEMSSACSGMVEFVNNAINVSNVYSVKGDCDMSVGNIDFDGSVHISGCVRAGHTVKATGGISVGGGVQSATLIAGGNVEVKGGMQGSGKGLIEAGGSVSIMYIEQGTISAQGPVTVDVSIHSRIETGSTIHVKGKRGAIIGGQAAAAGDIVANFIGTLAGTRTEVEVGFMPKKRSRIQEIEKEMEKIAADIIKINQLDAYLAKSKGAMDNETWTKLHISGKENRRINNETSQQLTEELAELNYELEHATDNKVHVFDTAFSGSRISIGSSSLKLTGEINYATFRYSSGEVVYGPCEISKKDS
ncbi:MAG: FapA family protein [Oscillospiraceae bacterium]|nr:FapA family protein [Oscillospiraceae bacterium]